MTDHPENLFRYLYKRAPSEADMNRLLSVKALLGLSDNDELWPFILTMDHYSQIHIQARVRLIKEVKAEITRFEKIMAQSDRVAQIEAQKAVEAMIDESAAQIAEAAIEKVTIPSALLAKQKLTSAIFIGALLGVLFTAIGAGLMYFWLFTQGVCENSERRLNGDARLTCVVQRLPFSA